MKTVVVVGGGFAGAYALKELSKARNIRLCLFEPKDHFVFTPLLHEVATAAINPSTLNIKYTKTFPDLVHINEPVSKIDLKKSRIYAGKWHSYDYVIIATGAQTNFFGNTKAQKYALPLKSEIDAHRILVRLQQAVQDTLEGKRATFTVVGGGPTGVELAAEMAQFFQERCKDIRPKIRLVQAAPTIVPTAHPRLQELATNQLQRLGVELITNSYVTAVNKDSVDLQHRKDGKSTKLQSSTTLWVAGVQPRSDVVKSKPGHHVLVDADLSVWDFPNAFAVGDVADFHPDLEKGHLPALAQAAVQEGPHAARNILRLIAGKPTKAYAFRSKGFLMSLGQKYAVGELATPFGPIIMKGFFTWWLWRTTYLMKLLDAGSKARTAAHWTSRLFRRHKPSR